MTSRTAEPSGGGAHHALKAPLYERALFLDGITRSGKKYVCKLVSHFSGIDMFQFHSLIEHAAYLHFNGRIGAEDAAALIQYQSEEFTYNRMTGRNLNERPEDDTYVGRSPFAGMIRDRCSHPSGPAAVDRYSKDGWVPFFHIHSVMPVCGILFAAHPYLKLIHMSRHPLDLSVAWLDQGWGRRELTDTTSFIPLSQTDKGLVPWYAVTWAAKYLSGNEFERGVESIIHLQKADANGYEKLPSHQRAQVLRLSLERLTTDPGAAIDSLQRFLQRSPDSSLSSYVEGEGQPIITTDQDRTVMMDRIRPHISERLYKRFARHIGAYETEWGLRPRLR